MFPESPCQADLDYLIQEGCCNQSFQGSFLHKNPRFYKYYFWIYHRGVTIEGAEFWGNQYRLPIKSAFDLINHLKKTNQAFMVFNRRFPRWDPGVVPFDRDSEKWKDTEWAPAFDEDADEEYQGFK